MPVLTRNAPKLLRQVCGERHASQDDHHIEKTLPTPPQSRESAVNKPAQRQRGASTLGVEDYTRDPESSEEETKKAAEIENYTHDPLSSDDEHLATTASSAPHIIGRFVTRPAGLGAKRPAEDDEDEDGPIFRSQPEKQGKKFKQSRTVNVNKKYGSQASQSEKRQKRLDEQKSFRKAKVCDTPAKTVAKFKAARGADVVKDGLPSSSAPDDNLSSPGLPPLNSPDSPDVEEIDSVDLASGGPPLTVRCGICQQLVNALLKEEFEDKYNERRMSSVRRQNAFCKYHRKQEAEEEWQSRGYPVIDWIGLDGRMRAQHPRLVGIINGDIESTFGQQAVQQHERGPIWTKNTAYGATTEAHASAGYYGLRGRNLMLESISTHLADDLRTASLSNPLISSHGFGGGVSGFVQRVLVPEMAVGLIMEDMAVDEAEACQLMVDGRDVAEILHDEVRAFVPAGGDDEVLEDDSIDLTNTN